MLFRNKELVNGAQTVTTSVKCAQISKLQVLLRQQRTPPKCYTLLFLGRTTIELVLEVDGSCL